MHTLRVFNNRDIDGVASVILPIQQDEFGIPITLQAQPDLSDIPNFYQRDHGNFWVAEVDGHVVGTIGLLDMGQKQAALRKMFVAQKYRGHEYGTAKRLLDALITWAASRGLKQIYLGTTDKFLAAHRFYEKNGFSEIGRSELPAAFPVMAVDSKFYRRELGA